MPIPKHGLGRGLGALIPSSMPASGTPGACEVDISRISPNPLQPRQRIDPEALQELADSIKEHGLIQPLIVTLAPDSTDQSPRYQLIAGERRLSAAKLAGLERVPVIIRGATPLEMLEIALVENIQRADLNALEEASAYRQLMEDFHLTQEEVAVKVGKNRTTIANAVRLLKLPDDIRAALADCLITEGHARAILTVEDPVNQKALLGVVVEKGYSVRQTEEAARRLNAKAKRLAAAHEDSSPEREMPPETRALEEKLRQALGTKVQVFRSSKGGKIVIHFYSEEELESVYNRITNS